MKGIFCSYLIDTKLALVCKLLFGVVVVFVAVTMESTSGMLPNPVALFATLTIGDILLLGFDARLDKFWRIMPIRQSIIVLSRYLHRLVGLCFGTILAIIVVLINAPGSIVSFNFIAFIFGIFLTQQSLLIVAGFLFLNKGSIFANLVGIVLLILPFSKLYLLFEPSAIHGIISNRIAGVPITSGDIFYQTSRWVMFVAISFVIYVISYFVTVLAYRKTDYRPWHFWQQV